MKPRVLYILLHVCLCSRVSLPPLTLHSAPLHFESLGSRRRDGAKRQRCIWGGDCEDQRERSRGGQGTPSDPHAGVTPGRGEWEGRAVRLPAVQLRQRGGRPSSECQAEIPHQPFSRRAEVASSVLSCWLPRSGFRRCRGLLGTFCF